MALSSLLAWYFSSSSSARLSSYSCASFSRMVFFLVFVLVSSLSRTLWRPPLRFDMMLLSSLAGAAVVVMVRGDCHLAPLAEKGLVCGAVGVTFFTTSSGRFAQRRSHGW